jgi:hypothetical protein
MRTTISIDDDLFETAKALAAQRRVSVGKVISELMRKGLSAETKITMGSGGFPIFQVPQNARPITLNTVQEAEAEM